MAMSSVSKYSYGRDETDISELRLELASLKKTRESLSKFLEAIRCVRKDLDVMAVNYSELKQVNDQWRSILSEIKINVTQ